MAELEHSMNCDGNIPQRQNDCTCGLKWRIMLQTEQEMHIAWRKRAEEAEKALIITGQALVNVHAWVNREPFYHQSQFYKNCEAAIALLKNMGLVQ